MLGIESYLKVALAPFQLLAGVGFVVSVTLHILAWFGYWPGSWVWALHLGIFVVFVPAVLVMTQMTKFVSQKDLWKAALRGCPPWLQRTVQLVFGYAIVNFIFFVATTDGSESTTLRGFSGHWMVFYLLAFSVLFSARRLPRLDGSAVCLNGHRVSALSRFCPECGVPLSPTP